VAVVGLLLTGIVPVSTGKGPTRLQVKTKAATTGIRQRPRSIGALNAVARHAVVREEISIGANRGAIRSERAPEPIAGPVENYAVQRSVPRGGRPCTIHDLALAALICADTPRSEVYDCSTRPESWACSEGNK